jgi:O-antigen/teichoic acid export membrane protein
MASDIAKPADLGSAPADAAPVHRRRGATILFAGSTVAQACALARYTVLARLLGPEQLGLAATMVLTSQFFTSITDSGSDRFLIQDRDGDTPEVQKFVQLVWVTRGCVIAAALMIFSGPISLLFQAPAIAPGLIGLALASLIFGFVHLDMRRAQRRNDFSTEGVATVIGEALGLVATVVAALTTRNFTAILYGLVTRSAAIAVVSHLRAQRPYAIGFSRAHAARLAGFTGPLMVNGLLMFMAQQGDRIVVGNKLGVIQLGYYSAVLLLVFYPSAVLMGYLQAIQLPRIAATRDNADHRVAAADGLAGQATLLAILQAAGFAIVGPVAITLLYGARYAQAPLVVCLIGVLQASRFLRYWPTTMALGIGKSHIVLIGNVVRLAGLAAAVVGAILSKSLISIALGLTLGEMAAVTTALVMINLAESRPVFSQLGRVAIFVLAMATLGAWPLALAKPSLLPLIALSAATAVVALTVWLREQRTIGEGLGAARRILATVTRS